MRRLMLAGATALALAGMGHNMPPVNITVQKPPAQQAIIPKRIADANRRNQKLKQKVRRGTRWRGKYHQDTRFMRKTMKKGTGYHPGKLFKGHRI